MQLTVLAHSEPLVSCGSLSCPEMRGSIGILNRVRVLDSPPGEPDARGEEVGGFP